MHLKWLGAADLWAIEVSPMPSVLLEIYAMQYQPCPNNKRAGKEQQQQDDLSSHRGLKRLLGLTYEMQIM